MIDKMHEIINHIHGVIKLSNIVLNQIIKKPRRFNGRIVCKRRKHNAFYNYTPFCFVASEALGIIAGYTAQEEVYIDDLIVIDKHRGRNIGTKLVTQVENFLKVKNVI